MGPCPYGQARPALGRLTASPIRGCRDLLTAGGTGFLVPSHCLRSTRHEHDVREPVEYEGGAKTKGRESRHLAISPLSSPDSRSSLAPEWRPLGFERISTGDVVEPLAHILEERRAFRRGKRRDRKRRLHACENPPPPSVSGCNIAWREIRVEAQQHRGSAMAASPPLKLIDRDKDRAPRHPR